jgi:hypothetical protein
MTMTKYSLLFVALLCSPALADDGVTEVDVRAAEFLDVIETADGSIWKGVVVEQTPNVQYKIATADGSLHVIKAADVVKLTKQRNRERAMGPAPRPGFIGGSAAGAPAAYPNDGIGGSYQSSSSLPPPVAKSGLRVEPELAIVFPTGVYDELGVNTSFAPGVRLGREQMFGNFGLSGGGHLRFTYWRLPGDTRDATWLLETQFYGRAALHIGPATPYVGLTFGLDTNYLYDNDSRMSETSVGFGMNLQSGLQISVSPTTTIDVGFDYHPGTDTIASGTDESVEYFAMRIGSTIRL